MTRGIIAAVILVGIANCSKKSSPPAGLGPGRQLKVEDFPNVKNSIFGVWNGDQADFGNELVYLTTFYFNEKNEIGVKQTCIGQGEELEVATVVDGTITESQFTLNSSAQVSRTGKRISHCTLTVHAGSFFYALRGDRLEFTDKSATQRSFTRVEN